jgi:hypothetical protein
MTNFENLSPAEQPAILQARREERDLRVYASVSSSPPYHRIREAVAADEGPLITEELSSTTTRRITGSRAAPAPAPTSPSSPGDQPRYARPSEPSSFAESVTAAIAFRLGRRLAKVEHQPGSASRPRTSAEIVAEKLRLLDARR